MLRPLKKTFKITDRPLFKLAPWDGDGERPKTLWVHNSSRGKINMRSWWYIRMLTFCRGYRFEMPKKLPWRRLILIWDFWFWTVTNHKILTCKDLFWCVICGTFNLLSQNLLVNKHKLQNQIPKNYKSSVILQIPAF